MSVGARIGARVGARLGARVGSPPGGAPASMTTQSVTVTDSADPVITGGDAYSYTVQYTNTGALNATSVSVAITVDSSLTIVNASGTGWSIGTVGQVITCTRATAAPGAAPAITVNVTTGAAATLATTSAQATAANAFTANGSQGTTVNLVTKDALAGIYAPASSTEWSNIITRKGLSISVPTNLWLCQEPSGNLADSISGVSLVAANAPSYQNAVTGWSRLAVGTVDAGTAKFSSTDVSLPDPSATSSLSLAYAAVTATPAGVRTLLTLATTNGSEARITTNPFYRAASGANAATGATTVNTSVHPVAMKVDKTAGAQTNYSDLEKLSPTWATPSGKRFGIGAQGGSSATARFLYVVHWTGSAAEMSDANVKALLQALGWTIPWT